MVSNDEAQLISVNFGDIEEGTFFYLSSNLVQCEKLSNNLAEDEKGNIILLVSSETIKIEKEILTSA